MLRPGAGFFGPGPGFFELRAGFFGTVPGLFGPLHCSVKDIKLLNAVQTFLFFRHTVPPGRVYLEKSKKLGSMVRMVFCSNIDCKS